MKTIQRALQTLRAAVFIPWLAPRAAGALGKGYMMEATRPLAHPLLLVQESSGHLGGHGTPVERVVVGQNVNLSRCNTLSVKPG